jgi:hypothetical protein
MTMVKFNKRKCERCGELKKDSESYERRFVYSFNEVLVDGSNLTLGWTNDYGEGGSTVITRTDGTSWPALKG